MQKIAGHPEETPPFYWWQIYARNAISSPTSTEALDAYVAEKVKELEDQVLSANNLLAVMHRDGGHHVFAVGFDQAVQDAMAIYYELTKQRDLAVSALEKIEKWIGEFPASGRFYDEPFNLKPISYGAAFGSNGERDYMRNVAKNALAAIKESES